MSIPAPFFLIVMEGSLPSESMCSSPLYWGTPAWRGYDYEVLSVTEWVAARSIQVLPPGPEDTLRWGFGACQEGDTWTVLKDVGLTPGGGKHGTQRARPGAEMSSHDGWGWGVDG